MKTNRSIAKMLLFLASLVPSLAIGSHAGARFKVLHAFSGNQGGLYGGVVLDQAGNLYGAERGGGVYGTGAVFKLTPGKQDVWVETVLYSFNCNDREGCAPETGLVFDAAGNLYGMTTTGGAEFGSVFELIPGSQGWKLRVLLDRGSEGDLILDQAGNLYGQMNDKGKYGQGALSELVKGEGGKDEW